MRGCREVGLRLHDRQYKSHSPRRGHPVENTGRFSLIVSEAQKVIVPKPQTKETQEMKSAANRISRAYLVAMTMIVVLAAHNLIAF